jgi:hypothetical protein
VHHAISSCKEECGKVPHRRLGLSVYMTKVLHAVQVKSIPLDFGCLQVLKDMLSPCQLLIQEQPIHYCPIYIDSLGAVLLCHIRSSSCNNSSTFPALSSLCSTSLYS